MFGNDFQADELKMPKMCTKLKTKKSYKMAILDTEMTLASFASTKQPAIWSVTAVATMCQVYRESRESVQGTGQCWASVGRLFSETFQ